MHTNMSKIVISLIITGAVVAGYFIHRKGKEQPTNILDVLKLKNVFDWIDTILSGVKQEDNVSYELDILPNSESQKLLKQRNQYAYVAVIRRIGDEKQETLSTKVFYAKSVDIDLSDLNKGKTIVIPIDK